MCPSWCESPEERERKVLYHLRLVRGVVRRLQALFPAALSHMSHEDGGQYGIIGLINAVDTYNPERGMGFEPYAVWKIGKAILNSLPQWHNFKIQPYVRTRWRRVRRAHDHLMQTSERPPTAVEIANHLRSCSVCYKPLSEKPSSKKPSSKRQPTALTVAQVEEALWGITLDAPHSLEEVLEQAPHRESMDLTAEDPLQRLTIEEITQAVDTLPQVQREIMVKFYCQGESCESLQDIAAGLKKTVGYVKGTKWRAEQALQRYCGLPQA